MPNPTEDKSFVFIQAGRTSKLYFTSVERDAAARQALLNDPSNYVLLFDATEVFEPRVERKKLWLYVPDPSAPPPAKYADPKVDQIGVPDPETIVTR